jgi:hypothetical protein
MPISAASTHRGTELDGRVGDRIPMTLAGTSTRRSTIGIRPVVVDDSQFTRPVIEDMLEDEPVNDVRPAVGDVRPRSELVSRFLNAITPREQR